MPAFDEKLVVGERAVSRPGSAARRGVPATGGAGGLELAAPPAVAAPLDEDAQRGSRAAWAGTSWTTPPIASAP